MSWHQASHTKDRPFCCPEQSFLLFVVVLGDPHRIIPRAVDANFLHKTKFEDEVLRHLLLKKWCKLPEQALQDDGAHEQQDPIQVSLVTGSRQVVLHNKQDVSMFDPVHLTHASLYVSDLPEASQTCYLDRTYLTQLLHLIWQPGEQRVAHLPELVCVIWVQPKWIN